MLYTCCQLSSMRYVLRKRDGMASRFARATATGGAWCTTALLDACERFREDMGEVTDNVSLATALETLWAERVEAAAAARANLF